MRPEGRGRRGKERIRNVEKTGREGKKAHGILLYKVVAVVNSAYIYSLPVRSLQALYFWGNNANEHSSSSSSYKWRNVCVHACT